MKSEIIQMTPTNSNTPNAWRQTSWTRVALSIVLILITAYVPGLAQAQTTGALYILSPANGQKFDTSFVRLQFELVPGVSANGIPEFKVQLDKENPVLTSDTEYFFYWLTPGWHSVSVSLVDANGTPIFGVQNQVQFYV